MFDLDALLEAGFEKALTTEEWEVLQKRTADRYSRTDPAYAGGTRPGGVVVDYVLERGDIRITTEQNTQDQAPFGVQMTVRYPQIVVIENTQTPQRVSCDASNTALILALVEEMERFTIGGTRA